MLDPTRRLLARLGRWPRRIAALSCLVLAAGSALTPRPAAAPTAAGITLRPGDVAVPVTVGESVSYLHAGDHIGVVAVSGGGTIGSGTLLADHLRLLAVRPDDGVDAAGSVVIVETTRAVALRLASVTTEALRLIVDDLP